MHRDELDSVPAGGGVVRGRLIRAPLPPGEVDARTRALPVVVLTTSDEPFDIEATYALGVNSYIRKPVDFEQFVAAVKQIGLYWLVLNQPRVAS